MGKVKIESNIEDFIRDNEKVMASALQQLAEDVLRVAKTRVPRKDNILTASGKVEKTKPLEVAVSFGNDGSIAGDYAAVQEKGKRAGSKTFQNYTSPGTGKNFLKNAGSAVGKQAEQYLLQAIAQMKTRR